VRAADEPQRIVDTQRTALRRSARHCGEEHGVATQRTVLQRSAGNSVATQRTVLQRSAWCCNAAHGVAAQRTVVQLIRALVRPGAADVIQQLITVVYASLL
jgi:hypothetical protein